MRKMLVPSIFAFCLALTAQAANDPNVVAEINGKKLTKEEFDRRYKDNISFFKYGAPTKANVLNEIINFEIAAQEAKKMGLDRDPRVQEQINAVLYQALVDRQLAGKFKSVVAVSDDDAIAYCKKNPPVRIKQIFVPLRPAALKADEASAHKKIQALQAMLKSESFEKVLAKNPDEGMFATTGGDSGYVNKMQLDPALYAEARHLSVGEVSSKPVRSQMGLHLVKLTGVQDCKGINIPEWQRMVFDERKFKILQDYLAGLRSHAKVSVNEELVKE